MDFDYDCGLVFTKIGGILIENFMKNENIEKIQDNKIKTSK